MKLLSVILDIPTQALDAAYTYAAPDVRPGEQEAEVGCAVLVPFGNRRAVGFVMDAWESGEGEGGGEDAACGLAENALGEESAARAFDPAKLKRAERVLSKPYFNESGAACARFLAHRYIAPLSSCVRLFTPPGGVPRMVRTRQGGWRLEEPAVGEVDCRWVAPGPAFGEFQPKRNAVKQIAILSALERGELRVAELSAEFGAVSVPLKALEKAGAVRIERRRRMRGMEGLASDSAGVGVASGGVAVGVAGAGERAAFTPSPKPQLTAGQAQALAVIDAARSRGRGEVVLVDGVTGSGKTEVYLQAIERALAAGRTACVLVPEISLTPQTVARFRGRFGNTVAVMHSRMSQGERYDQWDFIRCGQARVVVGARSALFTPLENLGLIVIDEEHEGSYKQDSAPRYVARDVAVWMAQQAGAAVVLGSATPSLEALHACEACEGWHRVSLPERANGRPLPDVQVIDMAREFSGGHRSMFARPLISALHEELEAGRKAVLLLNQRGFAKFLLCRDCGFVPTCPECATSLTFHERGNVLVCHHCDRRQPAPPVCPECGSPYLRKFGAGTQRVEDELRALIAGFGGRAAEALVIRMDADTTSGKGAHQRLLEQFGAAERAVLLGTQMIAKGLDFDDVTLVGVINADTQLHLPDYRAGERTFCLIEQVAGRAGRAKLPGRVLVQTYNADAAPIRAAAAHDRELFLRDELPKRQLLGYPPYVRLANILVWGANELAVQAAAEALAAKLAQLVADRSEQGWSVLPAAPCVLAKLRGTYRWHVVVKCPPEGDLPGVLEPFFRARKADPEVNLAVDVDPASLL